MFGNSGYSNMMNWINAGGYVWAYPILIWSLFWKGLALWKSAKEDNKYWFIALLLVNSMGLLELSYLFIFAKNKLTLSSNASTAPKTIKTKK